MKHTTRSAHVHHLMKDHPHHHTHRHTPSDILMRSHHKGGASCYAEGGHVDHEEEKMEREHHYAGGISNQGQNFRKGGKTSRNRRHHAEGGREEQYSGEKPLEGGLRRGGRAKPRQHHYWGQEIIGRIPLIGGIANSIAHAAGTLDENKYGGANYKPQNDAEKAANVISTIANVGLPLLLKKGGSAYQRMAAGGAGKVRKGMMTPDGHEIR